MSVPTPSPQTVRRYHHEWASRFPIPSPGQAVAIPPMSEWPDGYARRRDRAIRLPADPEQAWGQLVRHLGEEAAARYVERLQSERDKQRRRLRAV